MATASPNKLSTKSAKNIQAATWQVHNIARREEREWPQQLLAAALARDGEHLVINHLAEKAAGAAIAVAHESGQDPRDAVRWVESRMEPLNSGIAPFPGLAWKRAIDVVLHLLGEQLRVPGRGSITAVDLAGALLLLQALGVMAAAGWRKDPQRMRNMLAHRGHPACPRKQRRGHARNKKAKHRKGKR
ncbi:hypothetical protein [Actinomadura sp. 6K520]|uniref:hypothetical protein n=1 Tax=Actinomadura sp. 6K520 TaxID=2530364 RepID=UPI001046896F|nr:hypothetical protein [Actinomadura sp. 6K520]TDE18953.1 hypothetical protein E1289_34225 [Actinomadura sp. 6K520]